MSGRGNGVALPLYRLGERRLTAPRPFAIGGLLPCGEAMLLIGAPKSGKSAVAVASARAVCTGELFFGRRVRRGLVVYVPAERYEETERRLEVALDGIDDDLLRLSKARVYADHGDADRLAASILALAEETGMPPTLVVFDTVAALLRAGAGDENSQRDMGRLTDAIDRVRERTGAAVILVHHAKRGEKRSRGSEALEAWADIVAIADGKGDARKLSVLRSNTVDDGVKATFTLMPVDLGEDEETGSRSSVVLAMPVDRSAPTSVEPIRLAPDVETAFSALQKRVDPIAFEEWRSLVMAAFSDKPTANARRVAFSNAKKKLEDEGLIVIENETVSVRDALS